MLLNFPRFSWQRPGARAMLSRPSRRPADKVAVSCGREVARATRMPPGPRRRHRPAASVRPIFELLEDRTVPRPGKAREVKQHGCHSFSNAVRETMKEPSSPARRPSAGAWPGRGWRIGFQS